MDDIKQRLQECYDTCFKNFDAWTENKKSSDLRESLQESIHELRKVTSRLEIEIAVSERDAASTKQIPIPSHRSTSKAKGAVESILPDEGNTIGDNGNGNGGSKDGGARRSSRVRRAPSKKSN